MQKKNEKTKETSWRHAHKQIVRLWDASEKDDSKDENKNKNSNNKEFMIIVRSTY